MTELEKKEFVKENYDSMTTEEIGKAIGKSGNAVRKMAFVKARSTRKEISKNYKF